VRVAKGTRLIAGAGPVAQAEAGETGPGRRWASAASGQVPLEERADGNTAGQQADDAVEQGGTELSRVHSVTQRA
jgi:hypothetical protein